MDSRKSLSSRIREQALHLGFDACGFSRVRRLDEHASSLNDWISRGDHATMHYMEKNRDKRLDPSLLVENARSVISLLVNYYSSENLCGSPLKIAKYAYGEDYHEVIHAKLNQLDAFIKEIAGANVTERCFTDSAPILERAWAQQSGLGWIGKNSCLISRRHGSFIFIAEIVTSLELDYDESLHDYCGNCNKCITACPTNAISDIRTIDSNRCISYHTIENKGEIPSSLSGKFQNYIFGCDICQMVCPWNKKAHPHQEPGFSLTERLKEMTTEQWQSLSEDNFRTAFKKSALRRTKYSGLKRNISFVINNNGNLQSIPKSFETN